MKLWIDADDAPREVKEIVFRAARRLELPAVLVLGAAFDVLRLLLAERGENE